MLVYMAFDIKYVLATNLKKLMDESESMKTQTDLAKWSKVSQRTISNYLNPEEYSGSPTLNNVEALAKAFKLDTWKLLHPNFGRIPPDAEEALRKLIEK